MPIMLASGPLMRIWRATDCSAQSRAESLFLYYPVHI
jgi:hypothetical protein